MKTLSYHGKSPEQAQWVLETYSTPEKLEYYKDNKGFQEWIAACRQVIEARRDY